jgi:GNAT superfamily N-acetyltransferase
LEGNQWDDTDETKQLGILERLRLQGTAIIATTADGATRVGFVLWERGCATPFVPNGTLWWNEFGWIAFTWVHPSFRRLGIARAIYNHVNDVARLKGLREMQLDVYEINTNSIRFHTALGYSMYATVCRKSRPTWTTTANLVGVSFRKIDVHNDEHVKLIKVSGVLLAALQMFNRWFAFFV